MSDQHTNVAPPCWSPSELVQPGQPEYYCQRGKGHPGLHEVMLRSGGRMEWGPPEMWPNENENDE